MRRLASALQINLSSLPARKSAPEKLTLAAALKRTTSVSKKWLAQRLQIGAASSLGPLLYRYRASGAMDHPAVNAVLSQFLT